MGKGDWRSPTRQLVQLHDRPAFPSARARPLAVSVAAPSRPNPTYLAAGCRAVGDHPRDRWDFFLRLMGQRQGTS